MIKKNDPTPLPILAVASNTAPTHRPLTADEQARLSKTLPVGSTYVREDRVNGKVVRQVEVPLVGRAARRRMARDVRRKK